ncbi:YcnI family protein [Undibacterium sp. CY18W]|uniref:YcnI family protein n=1 Tax=Undibacterium hunanense TaxID=2762292 RepID=A0ABR6ZTT9_9BURK|nr:YcnI family protein [Undibacterium hunanense]MBC3919263.1 YcnI family protein [Undibacterium hunanense]
MKKSGFILLAALFAQAASAHITLDQAKAPAGSYQKLTFKVGHGCDGSATHTLTVILPETVSGAKPMPKAGWKIDTVIENLSTPYTSHGKTISRDVREVSWSGGPLPDAYYDEFSIQVKLPDTAGKLAFKVLQLCEKGRLDWVEVPAEGQSGKSLKTPAPVLELVNHPEAEHHH